MKMYAWQAYPLLQVHTCTGKSRRREGGRDRLVDRGQMSLKALLYRCRRGCTIIGADRAPKQVELGPWVSLL